MIGNAKSQPVIPVITVGNNGCLCNSIIRGLAYQKNALVNWDPVDQTVLANEQVVDGCGWRSGATVERREISQWFLRITDYADELLHDLDELTDWPEQVLTMQRNWIGRSRGVSVKFTVSKERQKIDIFTTRPDTLMGVTYIGIAPEHPLASACAKKNKAIATFIKQCQQHKVAEADIATQDKLGMDSGLQVIHPITKAKLPIWITNFVLMEYGSGAVMAVPAHDQRDFEFAIKYDLPIKPVIKPRDKQVWDFTQAAYTGHGKLIDSDPFDNLDSQQAFTVIATYLSDKKLGGEPNSLSFYATGEFHDSAIGAPPFPLFIVNTVAPCLSLKKIYR